MAENEYIPKHEQAIDDVKKKSERKSVKTPVEEKASKDTSEKSKLNLKSLNAKINPEKRDTVLGATLLLSSIFIFLACFSYLFTWKVDQDQLLNKGFFEFIFATHETPIENLLGNFGAWISHFLIFSLFGIAAFAIPFLLFIPAIKRLFKVTLLPIKKTYIRTIVMMLWGSLFFGFFSENINYLGGSFGYYTNQWLRNSIGLIGAIALTGVLFYVFAKLLFDAKFSKLIELLSPKKQIEGEDEEDEEIDLFEDMRVTNTLKEDLIKKDELADSIIFGAENEYEDASTSSATPDDIESESELIVSYKEEEIDLLNEEDRQNEDEFEVAIAEAEKTMDKEELNSLQKEYGDYDPKLDLSSYALPSIDLLKEYGSGTVSVNKQELEDNKNKIVETLSHYKIDIAKISATVGPTVTLYEIVPAPGVRISKIKNLEDDIALSLSALGIRIIAPIPGKGTIGIEVPNSNPEMVSMRSLIASEKFQNSDFELPIVMGKTITNETFCFDLTKMPHLLVAGATGQGKSVGLNAILISLLYKKHPAQVKFVLVDPKKVELTLFNKIERHFLAKLPGEGEAIITDTSKVVATLNSLCMEMDDRYELLKEAGCRTIKEYNTKFIARRLNPEKGHRYLPYIVVLIDEFADLIMTAGKEVEHPIARIAQLARAIGIHLIVATQRPSVSVITGMIKANFPARIAFRVLSQIDSRTILDASGANQLIGRGDMLISTGSDLKRLQCGFVDTPEVEAICDFIGNQRAYPDAYLLPEYVGEGGDGNGDIDMNEIDPMFADAARIVVINQQGSASLLQRKLKLGYNRAGRIVDQLEGMGIIGAFQGSKAREVLYGDIESLDEFLRTKGIV
ncbi:MAG: DNA translocase FtsK [Bacteroidota bacterium]